MYAICRCEQAHTQGPKRKGLYSDNKLRLSGPPESLATLEEHGAQQYPHAAQLWSDTRHAT